jgi:REP element-mobilizing transposase RayT
LVGAALSLVGVALFFVGFEPTPLLPPVSTGGMIASKPLPIAGFSRLLPPDRTMFAHVFHEVFLHINWHVKDDRPTLKGRIERIVHETIRERCARTKGVYLHAINGTETHVHLAVSIEPFVTISQLVKDLKGGSSHDANSRLGQRLLYWRRGYGVVSFGKNHLDWVVEYIARQKEHHSSGRVFERLEQTLVGSDSLTTS